MNVLLTTLKEMDLIVYRYEIEGELVQDVVYGQKMSIEELAYYIKRVHGHEPEEIELAQ